MSDDRHRTLGWPAWRGAPSAVPPLTGRVVRPDRGWVRVALLDPADGLRHGADADGVVAARTREDRIGTAVVGDWVVLDDEPEDLEVATILERSHVLRRADPVGAGEQVLAANIDRVLVVAGLDRPRKLGRIQRALVQAFDADADAQVVLTKADLVHDAAGAVDEVIEEVPGVLVTAVSAHAGDGLDALRAGIEDQTTVLLGESGAGKSSLLNALGRSDRAAVGAVRSTDAKGRHTTTRRELHRVGDGLVIDTPGVRAIGLYADPEAVDALFPDVVAAAQCRFADCAHGAEPGCGVVAALDAGELARARVEAHRTLRLEAETAIDPPPAWR